MPKKLDIWINSAGCRNYIFSDLRKSYCRYDRGVLTVVCNVTSSVPVDYKKTKPRMQRAMYNLFNCPRTMLFLIEEQSSDGKTFPYTVQYFCRIKTEPTNETIAKMKDIITDIIPEDMEVYEERKREERNAKNYEAAKKRKLETFWYF